MAKRQNKSNGSAAAASSAAPKRGSVQEFNPDYTNIIRDLKTIGIMAISFTTILIVLSFVLK